MKRVIFTTYDDIEIQDDPHGSNYKSAQQIADYFDKLVNNKSDYAKYIGVDFKFFHNTMKDFNVDDELEFTKVNLYKHHLMSELANEYDEIMYIDMDVVFNTKDNVFEELDLSKGIHVKEQDSDIDNKQVQQILYAEVGWRNPTLKYHISKDLLNGKKDPHVINTGIMIGKSKHIKMLKFVDRLPGIVDKIYEIRNSAINVSDEDFGYLRLFYYPNNEAIFSYILEEYDIPYVIMDDKWHFIIDNSSKPFDFNDVKIFHVINKKFNIVYEDKRKAIFSLYIEIPDENLDSPKGPIDDPVNKSKRTKERLAKYADKLYQNHVEYSQFVNADYIHFTRDEKYEKFFKRFPDLSEYDIINLYKIYLLDELTNQYDLVLYVDFDVYFMKKYNAFYYLPGEHLFCCNVSTSKAIGVEVRFAKYLEKYKHDFRNPQAKYWNSHALLAEEGLDPENLIFNTGIMMASRKVMNQIDYFSDIDDVISTMKELKENSMYPPNIRASFGYDNETIMSYKIKKNNVPIFKLPNQWHFKHEPNELSAYYSNSNSFKKARNSLQINIKEYNVEMIHFISKNFGLVFDE